MGQILRLKTICVTSATLRSASVTRIKHLLENLKKISSEHIVPIRTGGGPGRTRGVASDRLYLHYQVMEVRKKIKKRISMKSNICCGLLAIYNYSLNSNLTNTFP